MKSGPAQQRPAQSTASTRLGNGTNTLTANLLWAFGVGRAGQSYLFKREDGKFYEARVTYFDTLKTIDFTPARALTSPKNVEEFHVPPGRFRGDHSLFRMSHDSRPEPSENALTKSG